MTVGWDTNHEGYRQIFCAALTGILANPALFEGWGDLAGECAVRRANDVVVAAIKHAGEEYP